MKGRQLYFSSDCDFDLSRTDQVASSIAYLVPCYRVVRKNGPLGGYRWRVELKRFLLAAESDSSTGQPLEL